jgi:Mu-like prophage I protein
MQTALAEAPALKEEGPIWLEALPARTYHTPFYGEVPVTGDDLTAMVQNFKNNVRGQEIAIDFDHGTDPAKGKKAAGWYKDFKIAPSSSDPTKLSLYAQVDLTDEAKKEVRDKHWKYFSLEWDDAWTDNDGNEHKNVIIGGGLTNRPIAKHVLPINFSESMAEELKNEVKEMEHSEPGSGTPPEPRTEEDNSDDTAIKEGWRRFSPPDQEATPPVTSSEYITTTTPKGGYNVGEYVFAETQAQELLRTLELPVDAKPGDIVESVKGRVGELTTLRQEADKETQEKVFAEQYPAYWTEHQQLMRRDRENTARQFSESIRTIKRTVGNGFVDTDQGLSALAKTKVAELHVKFAEGNATVEDFEECVKHIINGGIVRFGEIGSATKEDDVPPVDTSTAQGVADGRRVFAEVVARIQKDNPELSYKEAVGKASEQHPDLAKAHKVALPG